MSVATSSSIRYVRAVYWARALFTSATVYVLTAAIAPALARTGAASPLPSPAIAIAPRSSASLLHPLAAR